MIEEIRLPEISENVYSGEVIEVLVKVGDFISPEQSIVSLETEKANFEVPSPLGGKVVEINLKAGQKVNVGDVLIKVDTEAKPQEKAPVPAAQEKKPAAPKPQEPVRKKEEIPEQPQPEPKEILPVAPAIKNLAFELNVDLTKVKGSGPKGLITEEDVKKYAKPKPTEAQAAKEVTASLQLPDFSKWGPVERQPLTATRRKIAETLSFAWRNIPHVTHYDQADITLLEKFRTEYTKKVEQAGGKLTITSILMKIVVEALKLFPKFNTTFDEASQEIIFKKYYHISVAMDTEKGLIVPVIRDVDKKSVLQLALELTKLSAKARSNQLTPDDMVGGNFTISNLGGIGGTNFAPVIYWPQVAILGVARAEYRPVYIDKQIQASLILPLSISYDHRVIDGAEGARFLNWITQALEEPFLLIMQENTQM